jgi:hypothetical protein
MSRGPGRIERAIRELFDTHPDEAFTTDELCAHCYDLGCSYEIKRKHRVAVTRAANKVIADGLDWRVRWSWTQGHMLICYNAASLQSVARLDVLRFHTVGPRHQSIERAERKLNPPTGCSNGRGKTRIGSEAGLPIMSRGVMPIRQSVSASKLGDRQSWPKSRAISGATA